MKAMLVKTERGLRGSTSEDHTAWEKFKRRLQTLKPGSFLRMECVKPRNGQHHRKFFALLTLVAENSETYDTTKKALVAVKLVTGHFDLMLNPVTGEVIQVVESIAFDAMDQDKFDVFYSAAIDGVLRHILPHIEKAQAERLIDMIVSGWA